MVSCIGMLVYWFDCCCYFTLHCVMCWCFFLVKCCVDGGCLWLALSVLRAAAAFLLVSLRFPICWGVEDLNHHILFGFVHGFYCVFIVLVLDWGYRAGVFLLLKELCWPIITCCYFVLLAMYGMRRLLFCSAGCYLCDAALVSCAVGWLVGLWG